MRTHIVVVLSLAFLCLASHALSQQGQPAHHKVLTPEQQAYQQELKAYEARQQQLHSQAKQIFEAEMAREKADDDCAAAGSTYDVKVCYGKQIQITEEDLKRFAEVIRDLLGPGPQMPGATTPPPGPEGYPSTLAQMQAELDKVEQVWRQYREAACGAAFHQYAGGSLAPVVEAECDLRLARNHMRELNSVYGLRLDR